MDFGNTIGPRMEMPDDFPFDFLNVTLTDYHAYLQNFLGGKEITINSIEVIQDEEVIIDVLRIVYNYIRSIRSVTKDFDSADYDMIETLFSLNVDDPNAFENLKNKFDDNFFIKRLGKIMKKLDSTFNFVMRACEGIDLEPEKNIFLKILSNHRKLINQLYLVAVNTPKR